jgi:hypothetical protein
MMANSNLKNNLLVAALLFFLGYNRENNPGRRFKKVLTYSVWRFALM